MGRRRIKLGPRDRELLKYVGEQRMSWLEPLHTKFYAGRQLDAVKSTLRRLTGRPPRHRYLQPEMLDGKRKYFRLTSEAARMLGFSPTVARPLGRTSLIRRYAIQWFIEVDGKDRRWLCNPRDYPDLFPIGNHRLPRANFYLENRDGVTEVGFAVEDFGSDTRRITRRAAGLLERFLQHGWFDELIAADRFSISFLTITEGKAQALEKQFQRDLSRRIHRQLRRLIRTRQQGLRPTFRVVPALIDLIPNDVGGGRNRHHA